jgi:hypothetical protein
VRKKQKHDKIGLAERIWNIRSVKAKLSDKLKRVGILVLLSLSSPEIQPL